MCLLDLLSFVLGIVGLPQAMNVLLQKHAPSKRYFDKNSVPVHFDKNLVKCHNFKIRPGLFVELKQAITFQIRQIPREEKSVPE